MSDMRQVTAISESVKKAIHDISCHSCLYSASCLGKQSRALRLLHAITSSLFCIHRICLPKAVCSGREASVRLLVVPCPKYP